MLFLLFSDVQFFEKPCRVSIAYNDIARDSLSIYEKHGNFHTHWQETQVCNKYNLIVDFKRRL